MLKSLKNLGLAALLTLSTSCGLSTDTGINPIISNIKYTSNSLENSINRIAVTNEDIKISVKAREDVSKVELEAMQDGKTINSYEMTNQDGVYSISLKFSDSTMFGFRIKAHLSDNHPTSDTYTIPIYLSEQNARSFIKAWLDDPRRNNQYVQNAYTTDYLIDSGSRQIVADFNLEKVENRTLTSPALIEYIGENDDVNISIDDESYLKTNNINTLYIHRSKLYDYLQQKDTTTTLVRKQDIESRLADFYYSF